MSAVTSAPMGTPTGPTMSGGKVGDGTAVVACSWGTVASRADDSNPLAATFMQLLREAAARRAKRDRSYGHGRTHVLASFSTAPDDGHHADEQPLLWTDLPTGWRDDDLPATFAALLQMGGLGTLASGGADITVDRSDPLVEMREHWRSSVASPIPVVMPDMPDADNAATDGADAACASDGRGHRGRGIATDGTLGGANSNPSSSPSPGALAARAHRCADPSLVASGLATTGAMLAKALAGRDHVGADLVHGAPVVIVRVPQGADKDELADCIDTCLTQWPPASAGTRSTKRENASQSVRPSTTDVGEWDDLDDLPSFDGDGGVDDGYSVAATMQGGDNPAHRRRLKVLDTRSTPSDRRRSERATLGGRPGQIDERARMIAAMQAQRDTVVVLAADDTELSAEVLALADHELQLRLPDVSALAMVVAAVTGERAPALPPELWGNDPRGLSASTCGPFNAHVGGDRSTPDADAVDANGTTACPSNRLPDARFRLYDLRASLSPVRGARASIERLRKLVAARAVRSDAGVTAGSEDGPALEELAGYGKVKMDGLAIAEDLKAYRVGRLGWASVARGVVLSGPPGTGKSLFARALAKSAGVPLIVGSMADWQASGDGHLGDMLAAMKRSFAEARERTPCILFIDELDSVGDRASFPTRHRDYSTQVVNGLLQELDGAVGREGVVVIGATNQPHAIDAAILRPGRLERVVWIGLPNLDDLVAMLRLHLAGVPIAHGQASENGSDER